MSGQWRHWSAAVLPWAGGGGDPPKKRGGGEVSGEGGDVLY